MKIYRVTGLALFLLLSPALLYGASMSSSNYSMRVSVVSGGGGYSTSTSARLNGTLGQSSSFTDTQSSSSSANYTVRTGFWVTVASNQDSDQDEDGLTDMLEDSVECLDPLDADTDDDGIPDGTEDANHNGMVDYGETDPCDPDSDGDYIQDGTEIGVTSPSDDTDTEFFIPDHDPSTVTDPLLADTDGDGQDDGMEDRNWNGAVDPGESDPNRRDTAMPWIYLLLDD